MVDLGTAFAISVHRSLDRSRGTKGSVRRCLTAGMPVYLVDREDGEPRRVDFL